MSQETFLVNLINQFHLDIISKSFSQTLDLIINNYNILINLNKKMIDLKIINDKNINKNINNILFTILTVIFNNIIKNENNANENIKYVITNNDTKFKLFLLQLIIFNKNITSIDFEFHKNIFKILQIKLDHIFIVEPYQVSSKYKELFLQLFSNLLQNKNVIKVLHGGSQDLKIIFDYYLFGNKDYIIKFINSFTDTALLCDYYKNVHKCSLYHALYNFKAIDKKIFDNLLDLENKMPSYKKGFIWDFKKLDNDILIKYVYNDVLYLDNLYYKFIELDPIFVKHIETFIQYTYLCRNNVIKDIYYDSVILPKYDIICKKLIKIDYIKKYVIFVFQSLSNNQFVSDYDKINKLKNYFG